MRERGTSVSQTPSGAWLARCHKVQLGLFVFLCL
jgi:hypothetical protein